MEPLLPELDFSVSEFQQDGLLSGTDAESSLTEWQSFAHLARDSGVHTCSTSGRHGAVDPENPLAQAEPQPAPSQRGLQPGPHRASATNLNDKRQANREHQKRFRQRQKVTSEG